MAKFSATNAAFSGFGLIAREPLAVLAWGLVILVTMVLPIGGMVWTMLPHLRSMSDLAGANSSAPAVTARMFQLQSRMMLFNGLCWIGGAVLKAVIVGAVFRAILEPGQRGLAYMKLGVQELWLGLVSLVQGVLAYMVVVAAAIVVGIVVAIAYLVGAQHGGAGGVSAALLVGIPLGLAAVGVLAWAALRLSMAGPMSFAERKFLLFESWSLTRGQALPLLGMALLVVLVIFALELVLYAVVGGGVLMGVVAYGAGEGLAEILEPLKGQPPEAWLRAFWPLATGAAVVLSVLAAAAMALVSAPWARVYQQLRASQADPA